jgi:hypothetical protein
MAYQRSIIQLKPDFDITDLINVRLQQTYADRRTLKRDIPTTDGTNIDEILYCLREFQETATTLNFDTGDELFSNFCCNLRSAAKDDWDLVMANVPNQTPPATFLTAIETWKRELI